MAAIAAVVAACGGPSGHAGDDAAFLKVTAGSDALSAVDVSTRIELGHAMCSALAKYHGDTARADAAVAGRSSATLTPTVMQSLRRAAEIAYCPQFTG